jgi:hypothetical protein
VSVLRFGCIVRLPAISVEKVKVEKDPNVAEVVSDEGAVELVVKLITLLFE